MIEKRKRIFLLGGTGFIGAALTRKLAENRGENELTMLIHRRAPLRELEQINTFSGELGSFDLSLLDRYSSDALVHLARMKGRGKLGRWYAAWRGAQANRRIIRHLQAMRSSPHVIYISGTLAYGDCGEVPVDEDSPVAPVAFAREYIKAEEPWMIAMEKDDIPVTILRPPWIMGGGSWFAEFYLKRIRQHREVPLFGDGNNWMSLIDVEDCAGLIEHALRKAAPGRYYNIFCPNAYVKQRDFAEILAKKTGSRVRVFKPDEVVPRYGLATWEAFTFSNISSTKYPEFIAEYNFKYASIDEIVGRNLPADVAG